MSESVLLNVTYMLMAQDAERAMRFLGRWPVDGAPLPPSGSPAFALPLDTTRKPSKWVTVHALAALRHFGRVAIARF